MGNERLDRVLSGAILNATLARPELGAQRIAKQALREFDVLRQTLTGPVMVGLFDAPWVPVYILICFLIHPWIGVLAVVGASISVFLAWLNGHQAHFTMPAGLQSARGMLHYADIFRLADRARVLDRPELAAQRMKSLLAVHGIEG